MFGRGILILWVSFFFFAVVLGGSKPTVNKRSVGPDEDKIGGKSKRTFCNAFTGCGRKRGDPDVPQKEPDDYEDPLDDVARDILAEARLWEALQARNAIKFPLVYKAREAWSMMEQRLKMG